jgi:hypothetical protein
MHAVREMALRAQPFGALLAPDGSVDRAAAAGIFASFDRDGDGCIDAGAPPAAPPRSGLRSVPRTLCSARVLSSCIQLAIRNQRHLQR